MFALFVLDKVYRKLGQGTFSTVYECTLLPDNRSRKRKSPGGSAAVREAMSEYMDHQTERARRREAIGARPFPRHPPQGTRPRRSLF